MANDQNNSTDTVFPGDAVVLCGFAAGQAESLAAKLSATVLIADDTAEASELLDPRELAVVCLGERVAGAAAEEFLRVTFEARPDARFCTVVLAAGREPELFEDLVSDDRIYYLTQTPPSPADAAVIIASAVENNRKLQGAGDEGRPLDDRLGLELRRDLGQATLEQLPTLAAQAVERLLEVDRAFCLIYDPETETLWAHRHGLNEERRESAAAGVVSFVVRTRTAVSVDELGADPRYEPEADNNSGARNERFLGVPIAVDTPRRRVLGVLVALRRASQVPFTDDEGDYLQELADHVAPALDGLLLQSRLEAEARRRYSPQDSEATEMFRQEALDHHVRGLEGRGNPLQISPSWMRWGYRVLMLVFLAAGLFITLGKVDEYADGVAVVRVEGRVDVTATIDGTVSAVEVDPGQEVSAGALLVRLYGAQEAAEVERARREFELGLLARLRDPSDATVERSLGAQRAQRRLAEARLEERSVRAPQNGVVSDVRVREGQHLSPGEVILSLRGGDSDLSIVALIPGRYRPLLRLGMPMRLELDGYSHAYQHLVIDSVSDEVLGPAETRRLLGPGVGEALPVNGPVVLVRARLPSANFESDGQVYAYHDGIQGTAEIRIRSERILTVLMPGLKRIFGAG